MTDVPGLEARHASLGVARRPVVMVRGEGARVWDADGKSYIDCSAAHGWAALGHAHPEVTAAIRRQAGILVHQTESSYSEQRALWFGELAALLAATLGQTARGSLGRIHPCNSGAEAVEAAIKLARYATRRPAIVAATGGFHGRTLGALSATAAPAYREPFEPLVPEFVHVPFNDPTALGTAVNNRTAAVLVEVVQGEGGVRPATAAYLAAAREACDRAGALLMVDEIQTGLGRTGRWFACQHDGVTPDVIVLGKAIGGGIPMGVAVWRDALGTFEAGLHGSTFGGNPLACAASRATLGVLAREALPQRAGVMGAWLLDTLRSITSRRVSEVRGRGLMIGIELREKVTPILKALMDRGVWALPAGPNVLRLLPPLIIPQADLDLACEAIREVLA